MTWLALALALVVLLPVLARVRAILRRRRW